MPSVKKYRIVNIGEGGVGNIEEYDPTIEDSYRKQVDVDDDPCIIDLLDTAGQEEFSSMRDSYMRTGDGFLVVYAITNRSSFENVPSHYQAIRRATDSQDGTIPVALVGNKKDMEKNRQVKTKEGVAMAKSLGMLFTETSALTGEGIEQTYMQLIRAIRAYRSLLPKETSGVRTLHPLECPYCGFCAPIEKKVKEHIKFRHRKEDSGGCSVL